MKKLVFMFVALAAISFASCGNKAQTTTTNDSDSVAVDSLQQDSTKQDSTSQDSTKTAADSATTATPAQK